jgi:hypothetical protein
MMINENISFLDVLYVCKEWGYRMCSPESMAASDASEVVALAREAGRGEKDVSVVALGGERREGKLFQTMQI